MFNADRVDGSAESYERFSMPDAILGLGSHAATMGLSAMGGSNRAKHRAFCFWCLIAATATFAMVPLAIREAIEAFSAAAQPHTSPQ